MSRLSTILSFAVALAAPLTAAAQLASAQAVGHDSTPASPRFRFAVGGGFASNAPFGGAGGGDLGYSYTGALEMRTPVPGLRARTDAFLANWGGDQQLAALSAGVALRAPERWRVAPALIATAGGYRPSRSGRLATGWSLGVGLRVPLGASALLLESRIHAFRVGERDLASAGVSPFDLAYDRWQYTSTPLTFSIEF